MKPRPPLRLVPFNPNDYSLGEVLVKDSQEEVTSNDSLSAILSLILQWPDNAVCFIQPIQNGAATRIFLDCDREERNLEEIRVRFEESNSIKLFLDQKLIRVRVEIFHQCYEFQCEIIAINRDQELNIDWHMIASAPPKILFYKQRRLPRYQVSKDLSQNLPKCTPIVNGKTILDSVLFIELGTRSIKIQLLNINGPDITHLRIGAINVPVSFVRAEGESAVFNFNPIEASEIGAIFDLFRLVAFPHLRPRSNFSTNELLDLYVRTKYIQKFQTTAQTDDRLQLLSATWDDLKPETHRVTADYVTIDDAGNLAGASSTTLSFVHDHKPTWVFHQLCSITSPNLLEQSGELYNWRAVYLASRPEDLDVMFWFDSKSRWLERIYVKFAYHKSSHAKLFPISVVRKQFWSSPEALVNHSTQEKFGKSVRFMAEHEGTFGGMSPSFLNASGILDAVISFDEILNKENINLVASSMLKASNCKNAIIEISTPVSAGWVNQVQDNEEQLLDDVDRLCHLQKASLIDFMASVEHSIAVTMRKIENGESAEAS